MISIFSLLSLLTLFTADDVPSFNDVHRSRHFREHEELSVPDQVLGFLAANENRAFKARKIASQIGTDEGAVSTALSRLKDCGLVEHKAAYWAITDNDERLEGYSGYERTTALFNEQLGTEDKESWRKHAPSGSLRVSRMNSDQRRDTDFRTWRRRLRR